MLGVKTMDKVRGKAKMVWTWVEEGSWLYRTKEEKRKTTGCRVVMDIVTEDM